MRHPDLGSHSSWQTLNGTGEPVEGVEARDERCSSSGPLPSPGTNAFPRNLERTEQGLVIAHLSIRDEQQQP